MSPDAMAHACDKARNAEAAAVWAIERGSTWGYGDLVVDMRSIQVMKRSADQVIFDATHSCQSPVGGGSYTTGNLQNCQPLSMAALAAGADGIFCEVHDNPPAAISDADNQLNPEQFKAMLADWLGLYDFMRGH